jgi:hypothetical protein
MENVELDTQEERVDYALGWIRRIISEEGVLNTSRAEAERYYMGQELGNEKKGRSSIVMSDLSDVIEWILPSLMRIFCGGDDVCQIQPRGQEDIQTADSNNELVNYQLRIRNKWFMVLHDFFKDALLEKIGVLKYEWVNEDVPYDKEYDNVSLEELTVRLLTQPNTKITSQKKNEDGTYNVTLTTTVNDEYPLITCVPPYEVGFTNVTSDVDSCPFLYHKVKRFPYEIAKKYGKDKVALIKNRVNFLNPPDSSTLDHDLILWQKFEDLGGLQFIFSEEDQRYWIYECYFPDINTGEARKLVISGDVVLEDSKNKYGRPPFHIVTPIKLTHRLIGRSMHDLTRDLQRLHTALVRQILDNIYFSNNGRYVGDEQRVNVDDVLNNNVPGGFIRGDPTAIQALPVPQLQPWTFNFLQLVEEMKQDRTGITKYTQGLDSNDLNKTARGLQTILQQSQQRLEMMARLFAEMGISPLVNSVLDMNMKFLQNKVAFKLRGDNQWTELNPENIISRWDILVDVGIGTGSKDQIVAEMQQLLGIYAQIVKSGMNNIVSPMNVYNACKELVKAMGFRNIDDFFTKPDGMTDPAMPPAQQGMPGQEQEPNAQVPNGGTMVNQQTPTIPHQPSQPGQPRLTPTGNGFYG